MTELFGERLQRLREAKGLSIGFVAQRLGVTHPVVRRAEQGEYGIRWHRLPALARLYGVSIDYLVTGREPASIAALHQAIRSGASQKILLAMLPNHD